MVTMEDHDVVLGEEEEIDDTKNQDDDSPVRSYHHHDHHHSVAAVALERTKRRRIPGGCVAVVVHTHHPAEWCWTEWSCGKYFFFFFFHFLYSLLWLLLSVGSLQRHSTESNWDDDWDIRTTITVVEAQQQQLLFG
jgi:hypothetical protein